VVDRSGEGKENANLGNANQLQGEFLQAIEYHMQHLAIAKEVGDRAGEGSAHGNAPGPQLAAHVIQSRRCRCRSSVKRTHSLVQAVARSNPTRAHSILFQSLSQPRIPACIRPARTHLHARVPAHSLTVLQYALACGACMCRMRVAGNTL